MIIRMGKRPDIEYIALKVQGNIINGKFVGTRISRLTPELRRSQLSKWCTLLTNKPIKGERLVL
jgi:hypothetical protein